MSTTARPKEAKKDWGHDTTGCTVLHVDMDAFFASCEIARHPELRGRPVIIGTGTRSVVSAASYEARRYGVNSAMPLSAARRRCPDGAFLPVDMDYYRAMSRRVFAIFDEVTPIVERMSVDEGYLDVSGALLRWPGGPEQIGAWIRTEVRDRLGLTCSVGVAANKLIAKLASTIAKPDGMLVIPRARSAEFIQMMPVGSVPGIGPALAAKLAAWGCESVAQMARMTMDELLQVTGSPAAARTLWQDARGLDDSPVSVGAPEKSLSAERTFAADQTTLGPVADLVRECCDETAARLRDKGLAGRTITVKLRFGDLSYVTRSRTFDTPMDTAAQIFPRARQILCTALRLPEDAARGAALPARVRLAGVAVSSLSPAASAAYQPGFDDLLGEEGAALDTDGSWGAARKAQEGKAAKAERALDAVRRRFGDDAAGIGM